MNDVEDVPEMNDNVSENVTESVSLCEEVVDVIEVHEDSRDDQKLYCIGIVPAVMKDDVFRLFPLTRSFFSSLIPFRFRFLLWFKSNFRHLYLQRENVLLQKIF